MTRRSILALLVLGTLSSAACRRRPSRRIGRIAPPIVGKSWLNVPAGSGEPGSGGFVLASFFAPT
ncbi:MAG: hypothetical protein ACREQJ_17650 [Candidatus Binatia bacterium]